MQQSISNVSVVEAFELRKRQVLEQLKLLRVRVDKVDANFDVVDWSDVQSLQKVGCDLEELVRFLA